MLPLAILDSLDGVAEGELDSLPDFRTAPLSGKPLLMSQKVADQLFWGLVLPAQSLTDQFCIYVCGRKDIELAEVPSP